MLSKIEPQDPKVRSDAYLWEVPGKSLAVYIGLDVVDRMSQDVMRGFGAVPKRGAEVGGILLGKNMAPGRLTVEIDDYELIPIEYKRGPSYLLSDADLKAFEETFGRLRHGFKNGFRPVGLFRSQTRDAVGLGHEDLDLMAKFFPEPDKIVLLIRPFATKVSMAGFYFREDGEFQGGPPLVEFPFRRKELGGGDEVAQAPNRPRQESSNAERPIQRMASQGGEVIPISRPEIPAPRLATPQPQAPSPASGTSATRSSLDADDIETVVSAKGKSSWMWLPLSFIFLLLGVLLGFQAALTLRPQAPESSTDPFNLALSVSKDGDNLNVRWDRQAPAIRAANRGVLVIDDGAYSKTVELDANQLQTGSVVYRHTSNDVKFRMELTIRDRDTMFEKLEWKQ